MGTEISLDVGSTAVAWSKNSMGMDHGALFQAEDRKQISDPDREDDEEFNPDFDMGFQRSLGSTKTRLELLGYTLNTVKNHYERAVVECREERESMREFDTSLDRPTEFLTFDELLSFVEEHPVGELDNTYSFDLDKPRSKDIVLYCISKLVHRLNAGEEISPWVELTAHEAMVATNWRTNRESYQRFEDALDRLRGTTIKTDIPTGDHRQTRGFGLIDEYEITRRDDSGEASAFGRMTRVKVKLSDWTYRAVQSMEVLTIHPDYFLLRRPLERRIYELARKHVGEDKKSFKIGLDKLQKKVGSNSPAKKFKFFVKEIAKDGHDPEHDIEIVGNNVIFTAKGRSSGKRQAQLEFGLPHSPSPGLVEKARKAAPGWDVYALFSEWREFASKRDEAPRSMDAAFLGYCKKRVKLAEDSDG